LKDVSDKDVFSGSLDGKCHKMTTRPAMSFVLESKP